MLGPCFSEELDCYQSRPNFSCGDVPRPTEERGSEVKHSTNRDYETVGYVISGSAKLKLEGQTLLLKEGDSWLVPAKATHQYTITERFKAIEATAPPAEVHGRDAP